VGSFKRGGEDTAAERERESERESERERVRERERERERRAALKTVKYCDTEAG